METELKVNITELDTFSTPFYFLYSFEYKKKTASFITPRTYEKLKMGKVHLTFSRVHEFKYDDNAAIRSGRGFIGEFNIFRPDSTELILDFDEYSEHPTLELKNTKTSHNKK